MCWRYNNTIATTHRLINMIRNDTPQNEAILSNVGAVGEFRIRNSAKAFNILSSGLYANKIRAIIRELSTNAVDSHIAAGRPETPFDVHLPTSLEPWFAVRDYGTGLTNDQVTNIYTTYFESTKTASNDFTGCLGLGSKSPFAYTDNFTVTAIKDGNKGIYTAFINDHGVPSIALMMEEATDEPSGVEVKFAVDNHSDFRKFQYEAASVYTYFKLRPVVNIESFKVEEQTYDRMDIVPGVHQYNGNRSSRAIMGNIAYPIDVPNSEQNLGALGRLLNCGLEMHFEIGELDFQASREGLSYIPQTIDSIRKRLETLNAALFDVLAKEVDAVANEWDRALLLAFNMEKSLWAAASQKYVADRNFDLVDTKSSSWTRLKKFTFTTEELAAQFNIAITGFSKYKNDLAAKNIKPEYRRVNSPVPGATPVQEAYWDFRISNDLYFAENDTKTGAAERGKYHWKVNRDSYTTAQSVVYIASPADKTKPMKFAAFMAALRNPPRVCKVSTWTAKPKETIAARDVAVLKLEDKDTGYWSRRNNEKVWRDAGRADAFASNKTYYYLPLSGYNLVTEYGEFDAKALCDNISTSGLNMGVGDIYGVRKADLAWVKAQKNWINLEDHVVTVMKNIKASVIAGIALTMYEQKHNRMTINSTLLGKIAKTDSPFITASSAFKNVEAVSYQAAKVELLVRRYVLNGAKDPLVEARKMADKVAADFARYPMLRLVSSFRGEEAAIADYINLIDSTT